MSIEASQNIYNWPSDTRPERDPFPVKERESSEVYFNGYEYAPNDLSELFAANVRRMSATNKPIGTEMGSEYGFHGLRMPDTADSLLTSLGDMLETNTTTSNKSDINNPKLAATFKKSSALRSLNIKKMNGRNAETSGTPVPAYAPMAPYGVSWTPVVNAKLNDDGATYSWKVNGQAAEPGFQHIGDLNGSGNINFDDFFVWVENAKVQEDGSLSSGGVMIDNATPKAMSNQVGLATVGNLQLTGEEAASLGR